MLNVSVYNSKLMFSILAFAEWYRLKENLAFLRREILCTVEL